MFRLATISLVSRPWLVLGAVAALSLGAVGCGAENSEKRGGANTPQAKENRKVAENSILESVQVAGREHVAVHGEPPKRKTSSFVAAIFPSMGESAGKASTPPPPAPPPAPNPPGVPPQITVTMNSKPDAPKPPASYPPEPLARHMARAASPVVISERVITEIPYPTEAEADARALEEAQKIIEKKLKELDPPVDYLPPVAVVKNEYVKKDSRLVRLPTEAEKDAFAQSGYARDRKYVEYTVELTAEQVRELRTRNRVADGLRGLGVLAAVSLAGFLFLRLDEWSKGYLTSWLALGAAALGGGVIAAVVFV